MTRSLCRKLYVAAALGLAVFALAVPVAAQDPSPAEGAPETGVTIHVVQRGETLYRIAQYYGTSVETVQAANNITDPTLIEVGQRLIIPATSAAPAFTRLTVQPTDTLSSLARQWGTPQAQLATLNKVTNPTLLFAGQSLALPEPSTAVVSPDGGSFISLQPDDTPSRIAAARAMPLPALLAANGLTSPAQIVPGQRLFLPGSESPVMSLGDPWSSLTIHPLPAEQGRTIVLTVETGQPGTLQGKFLSRDLTFVPLDERRQAAFIGVHVFTRPGVYPLTLTFTGGEGGVSTFSRGVMVADGGYASETIDVPYGLEALLDEALLDQEYARVSDLMSGFTPERYWDGLFLLPTGGDVSSAFGTRREYVGSGASLAGRFHSGADFAMPVTTPIRAPAPGVVVFAGPLEVRGNTTIIDHGWGVYTGYWHQAGILVQAGEEVQTGQEIGTVGNTGLVTGAHLHWELWVSGVQVDPLQWVRETMP